MLKTLIVIIGLSGVAIAKGPSTGPSAAQVAKDVAAQYGGKVKVVTTDKGDVRVDDDRGQYYWFQGATVTGDSPDFPGYKFATNGGVFYYWSGAWRFDKFQSTSTIYPDVPPPTRDELQALIDARGYTNQVSYSDRLYDVKLTIPAKPPWVFQEPTKFYVDVDGDYWRLNDNDGHDATHQTGAFRFFGARADKKAPWRITGIVSTQNGDKVIETVDKGRAWVASSVPLKERMDSERNDHDYDTLKVPPIASDRDLVNETWELLRTVDHAHFEAYLDGWLPRTPEFFPGRTYWSNTADKFSAAANHPNSYYKDGWCPKPQVDAPATSGTKVTYEFTDKAGKAKASISVSKQKSRRGEWSIVAYSFAAASDASLTVADSVCK